MSVQHSLDRLLAGLRGRERARAALLASPPALGLVLWAARALAPQPAAYVAFTLVVAVLALAETAARRLRPERLLRQLDAACPALEDSAALLPDAARPGSTLGRLQQARVRARFAGLALPELRRPWPWRGLVLSLVLSLPLTLLSGWPGERATGTSPLPAPAQAPAPRLVAAELRTRAPAYTGLAERVQSGLDARLPTGGELDWRLRFSAPVRAVSLEFLDGTRLSLRETGGVWQGRHAPAASGLYRLAVAADRPYADQGLHRLELLPDRPPALTIRQPAQSLSLREPGQARWDFEAEAEDDYGLGAAELRLTLAKGSGENIAFRELVLPLTGRGEGRKRRYRRTLALVELGLQAGDDLVLRLAVRDARAPQSQLSLSPAYLLRWPPEASQAEASLEGGLRRELPAYFRSQRQLILDTEALLAERPALSAEAFADRSDALGAEQKLLRLRYGQFLGEESESGEGSQGHEGEAEAGEGHAAAAAGFGEAGDLLEAYGHSHDQAEAATLLDRDTKALLKGALAEMWQSELKLRLAEAAASLPYQHWALDAIKRVQQATRIYLARVGLELPPITEDRRLSGERGGLAPPPVLLAPGRDEAAPLVAAWQALERGAAPDWPALEAALAARGLPAEQALSLAAAGDAFKRAPGCAECRDRLAGLLWPLLPAPVAGVSARPAPDAAGRAYLDALAGGGR